MTAENEYHRQEAEDEKALVPKHIPVHIVTRKPR